MMDALVRVQRLVTERSGPGGRMPSRSCLATRMRNIFRHPTES